MKDKKVIFIDLDGVILDVFERNYQVYKNILQKYNKKFLLKENYLRFKKEEISIKEILKKTKTEDIFPKFKKEWGEKIEKPYYLELDKISYLIKKTLLNLKNQYKLVLVTLRNHPRRLFNQLKKKRISKIFDEILTIPGRNHHQKWKLKYKLIKKYGNYNGGSVIIGDTETDILAGKHLGIQTVAVTNGMRSKKFLKKYKPDVLIDNFSEIKNIINGKK